MDAEILELRKAVAELPKSGRRRLYTANLKRRIVAFVAHKVAAGETESSACKAIDVHQATVSDWNGSKTKRALANKKAPPRVRAVDIVAATAARRTLDLVFPGGARVEGLTIADVAAFAKALR